MGGFAVVIHGAVRGTVDIDVLTSLNKKNLEKIENVLNKLGLQSRIPVSASEVFQFREEYIKNKNLIAWSFVDPKNPVNVVDVLITEDLAAYENEKIPLKDFNVKVISKKSLIKMKKKSGRPQDLEDVKALERIP